MINKIFITVESDNGSEQFDITDVVVEKLSKTKKATSKIEENNEPVVRLYEGKLVFTSGALKLMNLTIGDKIDIRYQDFGTAKLPVVGNIGVWNLTNGSKISKSGSIIFKGSKHDTLAEFGTSFILVPFNEVFVLTQDGKLPEIKEIPQPEPEDEDSDLDDLLASDNVNELTLE